MKTRTVEIFVGLFLLAGILSLVMLAFQVSGLANIIGRNGYEIQANFDNIGDLRIHAPVSIGGVRVGEVASIQLNPSTFKAVVTMHIDPNQNAIPTDSSASIFTEGLLGSNYISLSPGFSNTNLKNGDKIQTTHSALILENLIGQLMYKIGSGNDNSTSSNSSSSNSKPTSEITK
ncbi:MAG TPA: outer membrane lipid asymmetry maintenance protein MlaD [Gammaproteobacteria bacterium]|nr:outer membrane lipid asymmetry maintenance protein MlaD [Gammaproteobacteria bacterium]